MMMMMMVMSPLLLLITTTFIVIVSGPAHAALNKIMLSSSNGAVCLDGTPSAYYWKAATSPAAAKNFIIYFQGGGWCYEETDCWERSKGRLGSSKTFPDTYSVGGPMGEDAATNPDFGDWNHVYLPYCDGASFSGNADEPITVQDTQLYFRGKRILDETFDALKRDHGLDQAEKVVLTGCSAGGLATYLHADYVASLVPQAKYGSLPGSGFFMLLDNAVGQSVYPDQMKYVFQMQNSSGGVNPDCIKAHSAEDQWKCIFAQEAYAHTKSHIFPLQSAYDSWQTGCIFTSIPEPHNGTSNGLCGKLPGWNACTSQDKCTTAEITELNTYAATMIKIMQATTTFSKPGNGMFLHSCYSHCYFQSGYNTLKINGVTIQQAVSKWWQTGFDAPAENHLPCQYGTDKKCNPTCP